MYFLVSIWLSKDLSPFYGGKYIEYYLLVKYCIQNTYLELILKRTCLKYHDLSMPLLHRKPKIIQKYHSFHKLYNFPLQYTDYLCSTNITEKVLQCYFIRCATVSPNVCFIIFYHLSLLNKLHLLCHFYWKSFDKVLEKFGSNISKLSVRESVDNLTNEYFS